MGKTDITFLGINGGPGFAVRLVQGPIRSELVRHRMRKIVIADLEGAVAAV